MQYPPERAIKGDRLGKALIPSRQVLRSWTYRPLVSDFNNCKQIVLAGRHGDLVPKEVSLGIRTPLSRNREGHVE